MIQPPGIIFKGTGWYCTDHRPKPEAAKSGATGRASSSSAKETTGKSEKATASATT
jgi:predicted nucleic acid-binding Zn ribbon protein